MIRLLVADDHAIVREGFKQHLALTADIATGLSINNKTVSIHKTRFMEKKRFTSNADLVRYAMLHGLVE